MIVRIFRVRIHGELKEDFENDFDQISLPLVKAQKAARLILVLCEEE